MAAVTVPDVSSARTRRRRIAAGHPAGADLWARAKGWALAFSLVFLAHSADNAQLGGVGRQGLSAVLG
jgi:hypothetical protein